MSRRRCESFLLRIVMTEQQDVQIEEWIGRVQHVPSGKELRFSGAQELLAFINAMHAETVAATKERKEMR